MSKPSPGQPVTNLRVFAALLLSFLLITMPFAQMAALTKQRSEVRNQTADGRRQAADRTATNTAAAAENLFVNGPIPGPAPQPLAPTIVATMTDNRPAPDPASAKPGETINYTVTIQNTGTADATAVQFNDTVDAHTTLVAGSGVFAMADAYTTIGDVQISVPDGATDLLAN